MHLIYHITQQYNKLCNSIISNVKLENIMTYYSVVHASATLDSVQSHITHIMRFYCCLQMTATFVTIFYEVIPYCIILYHVIGLQSCYNMIQPLLSLRRATLLNSNITNYASVQLVMTN